MTLLMRYAMSNTTSKGYMKKNTALYIALAIILASSVVYAATSSKPATPPIEVAEPSTKNCLADDCLAVENLEYPVDGLSDAAKQALNEAIEDEYHALSFYEVVISKFGSVRPFSMIKGAEQQHIAALKAIFDKYGLQVPENTWPERLSAPVSLQQACQAGVDAEIANAQLYKEKLLPAVMPYDDITSVFTTLMNASEQKHLPAFERCN